MRRSPRLPNNVQVDPLKYNFL